MKTKVINLFGGPCAAKSTTAAGLFYQLKLAGCSVELVTEFAKELTFHERKKCLCDQFYVTAQQNHRMWPLVGKVDYIITDSPILLGTMYMQRDFPKSFVPFMIDLFNTYDNVNYFLKRVVPYIVHGRNQTEEEADKISKSLLSLIHKHEISVTVINGNKTAADFIFQSLEATWKR